MIGATHLQHRLRLGVANEYGHQVGHQRNFLRRREGGEAFLVDVDQRHLHHADGALNQFAPGRYDRLGLLPGRVRRIPAGEGIRVPHMGWNQLQLRRADPLLDGFADGEHAYFVHSYAADLTPDCIAGTTHGHAFAAAVRRGNVMGAQFHPERSAAAGARLLHNFLSMEPA